MRACSLVLLLLFCLCDFPRLWAQGDAVPPGSGGYFERLRRQIETVKVRDHAEAERLLRQGFAKALDEEHPRGLMLMYLSQAQYDLHRNQYISGVKAADEAIARSQNLSDTTAWTLALLTAAGLHLRLEAHDQAHALLQQVLKLADTPERKAHRARALNFLGVLFRREGTPANSRPYYREALAICQAQADSLGYIYALANLANTFVDEAAYDSAQWYFEQGALMADTMGEQLLHARLKLDAAHALHRQGSHQAAEASMRMYEPTIAASGMPRVLLQTWLDWLRYDLAQARWPAAWKRLAKIDSLLQIHPSSKQQIERHRLALRLLEQEERFEDAFYLQRIIQRYQDSTQQEMVQQRIASLRSVQELEAVRLDLHTHEQDLAAQRMYLMLWGLLVLLSLVGVALLWRQQIRLRSSLQEQAQQKAELAEQAETLRLMNHELHQAREDLETKVQQRTASLEQLNQRLVQHSFLNSHVLRQPLANILGLLSLVEGAQDEAEVRHYLQLIEQLAHELDRTVRVINLNLAEEIEALQEQVEKPADESASDIAPSPTTSD